jgi:hypothetical protein
MLFILIGHYPLVCLTSSTPPLQGESFKIQVTLLVKDGFGVVNFVMISAPSAFVQGSLPFLVGRPNPLAGGEL